MLSKRLVIVGLFAGLVPRAGAASDVAFQTMGRHVRQAAVIALVDAKKSDSPEYHAVSEFRELLKGRTEPSERTIPFKIECLFRGGTQILPGATGVAVLLADGWQRADCPVMVSYQKPGEIAALRTLTRIYELPSERGRLDALIALMNDPNPLYRDQLFDDLGQMREPANFLLIPGLFDRLDTAGRRSVVQLLAAIGDIRGVPTLLEALTSPDFSLRASAEEVLLNHFRGAPGVDEALRQARGKVTPEPETRFQTATRLWESGQHQRARVLFLAVAGDGSESDYVRVQSALTIAPTLSQPERTALQAGLRPLLTRLAGTGNYLELLDAAKILRALRSQENLDLLLTILDRVQAEFGSQDTACIATLAIRDLGPRARARAADRLLARIEAAQTQQITNGQPDLLLLALAWLGDQAQVGRIDARTWSSLHPLAGLGRRPDEGLFLIHALRDHRDLPPRALAWIAWRLGDLREKRSVASLIHLLSTSYLDQATTWQALAQIAGPLVESEAEKLLTHSRPDVRSSAIDILYRLQGPKMLPLLRRMIVEKDFGVRSHALLWIGAVGQPDDLKWLVPMADFWTGDRANHYWAMLAVAEIRRRYGLPFAA